MALSTLYVRVSCCVWPAGGLLYVIAVDWCLLVSLFFARTALINEWHTDNVAGNLYSIKFLQGNGN
jgi:hypothetical protein